jgi:hypothetical protein
MIYLLIDTCTWKELVSKIKVSPELLQIEFWVKNGYIKLLCPKILGDEWKKHRIYEEENINRSTKSIRQSFELLINADPDLLKKIDEQKAVEKLKAQIRIIDDLLTSNAIFVDESEWVRSHILITKRQNKPPFLKNKNSEDDASIIFSALEFIKKEHINDLFFVSSNFNEFGKKNNYEYEIHPEILEKFDGCSVKYFTKPKIFIESLKGKLPGLPINASGDEDAYETTAHINIDRNKKLLDQLYDFFILRFSELKVLPAKFWATGYPFKTKPQAYFYYDLYTLYTDNDELFNLFNSIEIEPNGSLQFKDKKFIEDVDNYETKIREILETLSRNLVFDIKETNSNKSKHIRLRQQKICDCIECNFRKLRLDKVFNQLTSETNDSEELAMNAYINYQLGSFKTSAELFVKLGAIEKDKGNFLKTYLINYNISRLEGVVKYRYFGFVDPGLVKKLKEIKIDFEKEFNSLPDKNIERWIREHYFFRDYQHEILEDAEKIQDYYQSQLYGGRGSNSYIWSIYTNQALLDSVLNSNHIIFDQYSEFSHLMEVYTEALLTSYAVHESMYSRLEQFDDWIIRVMVFYGNPTSFIKYCRRYSISKIKYISNSITGDGFMDLIRNFLKGCGKVNSEFIRLDWHNNYHFHQWYNKILSNLMILASYLDLSKEENNEISNLLSDFLKTPLVIKYHHSIKHIGHFIENKGGYFDDKSLKEYFDLAFLSSYFHNEDYLSILATCYEKREKPLELNSEYVSWLNWQKLDQCPICNHKHDPAILIPLYQLANSNEARDHIKNMIKESLDENYNWRLYYMASIYDILNTSNEYFDKLISVNKPSIDKLPFMSDYSRDELNRNIRLGAIINLCFKYHIDLKGERFCHLKGFDLYYDWLMDMDNFDYSKFNPRWINEYPTIHYFDQIKKHEVVRQKVFEYLKNNNDPLLKNNYLKCFHY